jgi:hypothetical protein
MEGIGDTMNYLRQYIITFTVSSMLTITTLFAAELPSTADSDDRPTTPPEYIAVAASVEPTPGQRVAERQREVFVRDRFEEVFGVAAIDELTRAKGIDWDVLVNRAISFDDGRKRQLILRIKEFMDRCLEARYDDAIFSSLFKDVTSIKAIVAAVPEDRLEEHARRYFTTGQFKGATVEFTAKPDGIQMGRIALVTLPHDPTIKYYIKTHSNGFKSEQSSAAKPVNAIELMVYKVLERLGIGCEVHFFGRDELNFYIATRDANEGGRFTEYSKIKRSDRASTAPLWGVLSEVLVHPMVKEEAERETIESAIAKDPLAQNFIQQISILDLLARLMLLTDLQTNGDNFGFVHQDAAFPILKVIDFRLRETDNFSLSERDFGGFLAGNGFFNYVTADRATCYALHDRAQRLRVEEGLKIFETVFVGWEEKVEAAKVNTLKSIERSGVSRDESIKLREKLEIHTDILKENFRLFETSLRQ